MSDGAAPVAAAPVAAAEPAAPVEGTAEPKPRTIDDDLEDVLKKHGGYKYKAAGKDKSITAAADLKRMLSRVDGTDSAASEALKIRQESDGLKAKLAGISKLPPRERIAAMEAAGVPRKLLREAIEEEILEEDAKEKQRSHLTQRERELQARLDGQDAELATYKQQQARAKQEQEQAEQVTRINEVGQRLEKVTVAALLKAKITPESSPQFIQAIAARLDRNERLGLGLDEDELADVVMQEQEQGAVGWLKGKAPPDLADVLESSGIAKPLMEEFAKRVRARQGLGTPTPIRTTSTPAKSDDETREQKIAAARTFGSRNW